MIRAKDGNGCCSSWCCCIRQQIAELWQRIEGTVRGVKMNGNIIEPDGDGIVDLDVNFPVDGAMDPTSVNPVQNRVVTDAILTERSERIEDDRRHDLEIQGLQTEMQTKLTTPSGGVQGQVLGKGAQGIGWVDTITEARAQEMEEDIASVDGRLTREIADREAGDTAVRDYVQNSYQVKPTGTPVSGDVIGWDGGKAYWTTPASGIKTLSNVDLSTIRNNLTTSQFFNFRATISGGGVTGTITMFYTGVCVISSTEKSFIDSQASLAGSPKPLTSVTLRVNDSGVYSLTYRDPDTATMTTVAPSRVRITGTVADSNPF